MRLTLLLLRLAGMVIAGLAGWRLGLTLAGLPGSEAGDTSAVRSVFVLALAGGALGLLLAPYVTVVPLRWLWRSARSVAPADLLGAIAGLLVGLLIAALASFPISLLPAPFGRWLPAGVAVLCGWLGLTIGAARKDELFRSLRAGWTLIVSSSSGAGGADWKDAGSRPLAHVVDTSAIIDGRIVEVWLAGLFPGKLIVPRFVLEELQQLADSPDPSKRQRGRRGLTLLERLQRELPVDVLDTDYADLRAVDSKLIRLARQCQATLVTTDYNLNRVAGLQGVRVMNVNDLAAALRSVVMPGEELALDVVQEGRERGQGVGYLEDGTMVVIEGGRRLVGARADVEVVRLLPTAGGRIVFARLRPGHAGRDAPLIGQTTEPPRLRAARDAGQQTGRADAG